MSFLLECFSFSASHTAENLAAEIKRVANEWQIEKKIEAVVTDNAANIVAAVKLTNWKHVPCFAHTLNLIVQNALQEIKPVQHKVKTIVEFFKRSPKASELLKLTQKQMGKTVLTLKQNMITRWNSTYEMFKRIIDTKEALISTIAINYPHLKQLSNDDFITLEQTCEILEVFKDVTEEISSETNVTVSKIILFEASLKKFCYDYLNNNDNLKDEVKKLGSSLLASLNKRFQDTECNKIFSEATVLDPRFKKHGFTETNAFEKTKENIVRLVTNLRSSQEQFGSQILIPKAEEDTSKLPEKTQKISKVWGSFDNKVSSLVATACKDPKVSSIIQIDKYLSEPLLQRTSDPLEWWDERKTVYPHLFSIMKRKLCVVGTSVPSERIFS